MHILWLATKAPWPPVDGGRLLMASTLQELARLGRQVTVVAPMRPGDPEPQVPDGIEFRPVPEAFRSKVTDLLASWTRGRPFSMARHTSPGMRRLVEALWDSGDFDLVHVEQVQALDNVSAALWRRQVPVLLRAQNVESDLWRALARLRGFVRPLLDFEGRLLAAYEGRAVGRCALTATLTDEDRQRLRELSSIDPGPDEQGGLVTVPPPFPAEQEPGTAVLAGDPALVIFGSAGWIPNRLGAEWFLREVQPELRRRVPGARLHLFTDVLLDPLPESVTLHEPRRDSADVFAPGSVLVVPLHMASGIRMKILEAWSRGVPVIATSVAARGLGAVHGEHIFVADDADGFVQAVQRLRDPAAYGAMVEAGRRRLREVYDPRRVAESLLGHYEALISD